MKTFPPSPEAGRFIIKDSTDTWDEFPAAVCVLSPGGEIIRANRHCGELFDSAPRKLAGRGFFDFAAEKERGELKKLWMSLSPGEPEKTFDMDVKLPRGHTRQEWVFRAVFDEVGALSRINAAGREVDAGEKVIGPPRPDCEKSSLLVENSPDVIYLAHVDDERYEYVSPAISEMFG